MNNICKISKKCCTLQNDACEQYIICELVLIGRSWACDLYACVNNLCKYQEMLHYTKTTENHDKVFANIQEILY